MHSDLCRVSQRPCTSAFPHPHQAASFPPSSLSSHRILDISPWTSDRHLKPNTFIKDLLIFLSKSAPHSQAFLTLVNGTAIPRVAQATHFRVRFAPSLHAQPILLHQEVLSILLQNTSYHAQHNNPHSDHLISHLDKSQEFFLAGLRASSLVPLQPILHTAGEQGMRLKVMQIVSAFL